MSLSQRTVRTVTGTWHHMAPHRHFANGTNSMGTSRLDNLPGGLVLVGAFEVFQMCTVSLAVPSVMNPAYAVHQNHISCTLELAPVYMRRRYWGVWYSVIPVDKHMFCIGLHHLMSLIEVNDRITELGDGKRWKSWTGKLVSPTAQRIFWVS